MPPKKKLTQCEPVFLLTVKGHFVIWKQVVPQGTKHTILALCVLCIGHLAFVIELI